MQKDNNFLEQENNEIEFPNYYAIIPASVRYSLELSSTEKLIYGEITSLANKTGICWAKNDYFAKLYNVSETTISTMITNLEKHDFIQIEYKQSKKRLIFLKFHNFEISKGYFGKIKRVFLKNQNTKDTKIAETPMKSSELSDLKDVNNKYNNKSNIYDECDEIFSEAKSKKQKLDMNKVNEIYNDWQKFATKNNLTTLLKLNPIRLKNLKARLSEKEFNFTEILQAIENNEFYLKKFANGYGITFDDIIKSDNLYLKILEGKKRSNNFLENNQTTKKQNRCIKCNQPTIDNKCYHCDF